MDKKRMFSFLMAFSVLFLNGCISYPQLITSQYVDKPVVIGPYWKVGTKIENYTDVKKQKGFREFETEVERVTTSTTTMQGNVYIPTTNSSAVHYDNISKDILMQNPAGDELILIKRCYLGTISVEGFGGNVKMRTFGGVEGLIIPKPGKEK